jgi:hypothetical protein
VPERTGLLPVVADGLDGAAFHGFLAESLLFGILRLLVNVGVTSVIVALEIGRGGLAAEIAVDALVVAVIGAGHIFGILVGYISHSDLSLESALLNATVF